MSEIARFTQEDPHKGNIYNPKSLNPYMHCYNNPLIWVDRDGCQPIAENMTIDRGEEGGSSQAPSFTRPRWWYEATLDELHLNLWSINRGITIDSSIKNFLETQNREWRDTYGFSCPDINRQISRNHIEINRLTRSIAASEIERDEMRAFIAERESNSQVRRVAISSGHGGALNASNNFYLPGATGPNDRIEAIENRRVVQEVARLLRSMGVTVTEIHDDITTMAEVRERFPNLTTAAERSRALQSINVNRLIEYHNEVGERDLDVQIHFNATPGGAGVETLHNDNRTDDELSGLKIAERISRAIVNASGGKFNLRRTNGTWHRENLGFLNNGNRVGVVAVLPEICFIDNVSDMVIFDDNFNAICRTLAEEIANTALLIAQSKE